MPLKTLYTIFCIAVFMFIAKPFIGFSVRVPESQLVKSNSILSKSFAIRKPDDLNDAKSKAYNLQQRLVNPNQLVFLTIAGLLLFLFPLLFKRDIFSANGSITSLNANAFAPEDIFLSSGKLTI
jgi:hypothetical protein